MAYNVLGIATGHNGSAALVSDGKLVYYLEEERLSRFKRDRNPFRAMVDICSKYKIDELIVGGTNDPNESHSLPWTGETSYIALVRKYNPKVKVTIANHIHHMLHASCAFYNSGFNKASILIIDGAGSKEDTNDIISFECESLWEGDSKGINLINKSSFSTINNAVTLTKTYEAAEPLCPGCIPNIL